jgi:hypothetical protein
LRRIRVGAGAASALNLRLPRQTRLETQMKPDRQEPNAELARSFEPLRVVFALSALLLGFIASVRF